MLSTDVGVGVSRAVPNSKDRHLLRSLIDGIEHEIGIANDRQHAYLRQAGLPVHKREVGKQLN